MRYNPIAFHPACHARSFFLLRDNRRTDGWGLVVRVYQFFKEPDALSALGKRRLRISRLDRLNDPFEFLGPDLSSPANRRALQETKDEIAKSSGLLCFCASWDNPILWSHYADRHKGLCLGFDMPAGLEQVRYVVSRFPWPAELSQRFMEQVVMTKFVHWSYEDEYRAWVNLNDEEEGHYYFPFSPELTLKEVIVGSQSTLTRAEISEALGDLGTGVEAFKVCPAFTSFRMIRNPDENLWT
jgi:hypothetical protein